MKKIINTIILSVIVITGISAQKEVNANEIIQNINNNQKVYYKNVIIYGDLDFTKLDNMILRKNSGSQKEYISKVETEIYFENCEFKGRVMAHEWTDYPKASYIANFFDAVSFINCTFDRESTFKHSKFTDKVDFTGTTFYREANFKHADFSDLVSFKSCVFQSEGNFKHTDFSTETEFQNSVFDGQGNFKHVNFPDFVNFSNVVFNYGADFKHVNFSDGVDFSNTQFLRCSDFKHAYFHEPTQLKGAVFKGETDFQHTKMGNKPFVNYLLQSQK